MADKNESVTEQVSSARDDARAKLASMQKKQKSEQRRGGLIIGLISGLVVIGLIVGGAFLIKKDNDATSAGSAKLGEVKSYPGYTQGDHVNTKVKYKENPPVGGKHNPAWANCGIYDKDIPNENAVHSMEHGAVWITYKPNLSKTQVGTLRSLASTNPEFTLMNPREDQPAPIVLSAWGKQLMVDKATDPKVQKFVKDFLRGPQTPEPNASCSGGWDPNTEPAPIQQ